MSCRKPCAECPFSRAIAPGGTGGADASVYVGQAAGPFFLPCHMDPKYEENKRSPELLQCAGAAIFRANIGVDYRLPPALLHLSQDHKFVFSTPAELIAHHREISLHTAEDFMSSHPVDRLLETEFRKQGVQLVAIPRQGPQGDP